MDNPKTEVTKIINDAQNVLVTVSKNPSVDQLAAALGMTLVLNKLGKHGTAVFSGSVPSTIEFLKPEETLEKNTDSLRDFIISLDKSKADKLRYKVEDQHVKIFITPYKTTIGQDDLVFSHGDFNVDVVLALGVHEQTDLDQAITAHGRILHDAKIISINTTQPGALGGINLNEQSASSLSEVMAHLSLDLKADVFDAQTATAFLTGIVAETERFSNEKTKPETMSVSAKLMSAGANQQLVATELQVKPKPPEPEPPAPEPEKPVENDDQQASPGPTESKDSIKHEDGSMEIKHTDDEVIKPKPPEPEPPAPESEKNLDEVHVDEHGNFKSAHNDDELPPVMPQSTAQASNLTDPEDEQPKIRSRRILEPPTTSGTLTASGKKEELEQTTDPLSQPPETDKKGVLLSHDQSKDGDEPNKGTEAVSTKPTAPAPPQPADDNVGQSDDDTKPAEPASHEGQDHASQPEPTQTLDSLEKAVDSPHQQSQHAPEPTQKEETNTEAGDKPDINELQSAVDQALAEAGDQKPLEPISALNANPVDLDLGHDGQQPTADHVAQNTDDGFLDITKVDEKTGLPDDGEADVVPKPQFPPPPMPGPTTDASGPTTSPPPVPPPMMPPLPNNSDDDLTLPPVNQ